MKDLEKIISGLNKSGFLSGMAGGALGGTVTSMLVGKKSKKYGKTAVKAGALAAVGGLAWKAYQSYNQNKQATQSQPTKAARAENNRFDYSHMIPQQEERFVEIVQDEQSDNGQMLLMRAMIAAAYADGHIDANEQQRIFAQVEKLDLSTTEKASLFDELRNPLSLEQLVANVPDAETGAEVYAASLLAIDERQTASKQYLQQLSTRLCIPIELKAMLEQQAGQAKLTA